MLASGAVPSRCCCESRSFRSMVTARRGEQRALAERVREHVFMLVEVVHSDLGSSAGSRAAQACRAPSQSRSASRRPEITCRIVAARLFDVAKLVARLAKKSCQNGMPSAER